MPTPMPDLMSMAKLAERLVAISDFSQGKAGKIFTDVAENDNEYIVLKNNKPTAVLMSIKEYTSTINKLMRFEQIFEDVENLKLLKMAQDRNPESFTTFEDLLKTENFNFEEIKELSESVEFE